MGRARLGEYSSVSIQLKDTYIKSTGTIAVMFFLTLLFTVMLTFINKSVFEVYGSGQGEVGSLALKFNALQSEVRYLVYEATAGNRLEHIESIELMCSELINDAKLLRSSMVEQESLELYNKIMMLLGEYEDVKEDILKYEKEEGKYNSQKLYNNEGINIASELEDTIGRLFIYMSEKGTDSSKFFLVISVIIAVISLIIGIYSGVKAIKRVQRTIKSICDPLELLTSNSQEIAKGNLHVIISKEGCSEIGILEKSLADTVETLNIYVNDISDKLWHIVGNDLTVELKQQYLGDFKPIQDSLIKILDFLNDVFKQIEHASREVNSGAQLVLESALSLAERTNNQKIAIDQISCEISSVFNNAKSNETLCEKADQLSKCAKQSAESGKIKMNDMVASMRTINESSNQISTILQSINDIAEQTNLLALNAQIEAARAGEAGKSFSVVANEVSSLADRCVEAARESEKMVMSILEAVTKGNVEVKDTAVALTEAVENIDITADVVNKILCATKEQQQDIEKVSLDINNISKIVHTYSKNAEEGAAASEQLTAQSDILRALLENMKLRNSTYK